MRPRKTDWSVSENGRVWSTASCARRTLAAATRRMASVIFCVLPTVWIPAWVVMGERFRRGGGVSEFLVCAASRARPSQRVSYPAVPAAPRRVARHAGEILAVKLSARVSARRTPVCFLAARRLGARLAAAKSLSFASRRLVAARGTRLRFFFLEVSAQHEFRLLPAIFLHVNC